LTAKLKNVYQEASDNPEYQNLTGGQQKSMEQKSDNAVP